MIYRLKDLKSLEGGKGKKGGDMKPQNVGGRRVGDLEGHGIGGREAGSLHLKGTEPLGHSKLPVTPEGDSG